MLDLSHQRCWARQWHLHDHRGNDSPVVFHSLQETHQKSPSVVRGESANASVSRIESWDIQSDQQPVYHGSDCRQRSVSCQLENDNPLLLLFVSPTIHNAKTNQGESMLSSALPRQAPSFENTELSSVSNIKRWSMNSSCWRRMMPWSAETRLNHQDRYWMFEDQRMIEFV